MRADRTHRAVTDDGVEIAGRVFGAGPPLVLVHGAVDDGELDWAPLLPHLSDRFTCLVISGRGRGISGDGPDHSPGRLAADVAAFAESVGEPVGLVGLSSGGMLCLGAASQNEAVSAVAAYEPIAFEAMDKQTHSRFATIVTQMAEAAADERPVDAARTFLDFVSNEQEMATLSASDAVELAARHIPVDLQEMEQATQSARPTPTDSTALGRIAAPVLLFHGSATALDWFSESIRYIAEHVPDPEVCDLLGAGHLGPIVEPARVARELRRFFDDKLPA